MKRGEFQPWHKPVWNLVGKFPQDTEFGLTGCRSADGKVRYVNTHNPVHYWPVADGFRWNANHYEVEWRQMFVEYPPRAAGKDSAASQE